jgi:hypothetical protein
MLLHFGQERDLWDALQTTENPFEQHLFSLQLGRLLLNKSNGFTTPLVSFSSDYIVELMIEHQRIASNVNVFLSASIPLLDQEYKGKSFEEKLLFLQKELSLTIENITRITSQTKSLSVENEKLTFELQKLEQIKSELNNLEQLRNELRRTVSSLNDQKERLSNKDSELTELYSQNIDMYIDSIMLLKKHIDSIRNMQSIHLHENMLIFDNNYQCIDSNNLEELKKLLISTTDNLKKFDQLLKSFCEKNSSENI